jgi:isopentenyl-diphosphate Delta-isomerase
VNLLWVAHCRLPVARYIWRVMTEEQVILVDHNDREIGTMGKMQAHVEGKLHRAISVFIFNSKGEWLLQKRADGKYHSGGLWTNACCSHPRPGEETHKAAARRLKEEMGLSCNLDFAFDFCYKADVGNGLIEYENDHVFIGKTDSQPYPDPNEASAWKYATYREIAAMIEHHPASFSEWFRMIYQRVQKFT